jgi:hypothetical protein
MIPLWLSSKTPQLLPGKQGGKVFLKFSHSARMRSWWEVGAVGVTGLLHLVFKHIGAKGLFIALASACWIGFVGWQVRRDRTNWVRWGFRTDNLWEAFQWPTVLFVLAAIFMAWYGVMKGRMLWEGHMVFLLLLYPLWGILQQFLVQALGVTNLITLFPRYGLWLAMPVGAVLFAVVHFPNWRLMLATGLLACFFIPLYVRDRNLWPLGLYHGWLGTFIYLWVLGRDPWVSVFGK